MSFYVSIVTIAHYQPALEKLLSSLPPAWAIRVILVYQNEPREDCRVREDGVIEVRIANNCSDYGNWIGLHMLLSRGIVPADSCFLCIHDTCRFVDGSNCEALTRQIIDDHPHDDIIWLCDTGQCNLCILRKGGVDVGYARYKDIASMTKPETIEYEWNHGHWRSPKSFPVQQTFLPSPTCHRGTRFVYNTQHERDVLFYPSIDLEKYFYCVTPDRVHPLAP
jgi:hypothetical protein